ncbi:MAG TPA: terpene cyclase/mutase family protein [Phycisphaerales bacterium]|nr:terpene cyclase/mutase family protein [Phycisphaerales bacterium]HMP36040.1 terpene cyclase/mutase family protein [Phycisphaerales bacterium]
MRLPSLRAVAGSIAALWIASASAAAGAALAASIPLASAPTQEAAPPPALPGAENQPGRDEMTPALVDAVSRGLTALRGMQNADGSFGRGRYGRHVAITSLAALAFMADGHLPGRGEHGEAVARALEFVLANSTESGLIATEGSDQVMYGHGFATLFLGEIYGMNPQDTRVRDALVRAVQLIVTTQNDEGGWRYNPVPFDADVSVTICEVMALRSARNAGIKVPKETIDRAVQYVRECQNPDGGFKYMLRGGTSDWPRTAAGVAALFYAGIYEDDAIDRGLEYLVRTALPGSPGARRTHYFYGQYYAVQAMYLAGGQHWDRWWGAIRTELLASQGSDGGWIDQHHGSAYATAMSLIVLQMPKRYLPIFQR